ncbi:MAG: hypothetical protein WA172_10675 [Terriglobales bacterium]
MSIRKGIVVALFLFVVRSGCLARSSSPAPVPGDPLSGTGVVNRTLLTYKDLFSDATPSSPVDDSAFALPANAAMPKEFFEGRLELLNPASSGGFAKVHEDFNYTGAADSPWRHLPAFSFEFVQNGSHLIPVIQGLIVTGNPSWNYIIGPGRIWREDGDSGYTRASFPFALAERSQNCVHNGEMMFLFSNTTPIHISKVRYQVTQETCTYLKVDMWGQLSATYTPSKISTSTELKNEHASEIAHRIPRKPFAALAGDFPNSGIDLAGIFRTMKFPKDITTYGLYINGTNYVGPCQTRYGEYAFCGEMRLPSYSTAKSAFASVAMMRLGQMYGNSAYSQLIRDFLPQYVMGGDWSKVTFSNTLDMATGNYIDAKFHADEDSMAEAAFLIAETYDKKIAAAFTPFPHKADPGTTWVYQSHGTFLVTQAMTAYLQKQGGGDDLFNLVRNTVYKPIHWSKGALTTIRTDDSETGRPDGYFGLFYIQDDVAKIGRFLDEGQGKIDGKQVLDPERLQETLLRKPDSLGLTVSDQGRGSVNGSFHYHNAFWEKHITPAEFHQYACDFWIPYMSGYGGISILLLPHDEVYYIFTDANEFNWYNAVHEINKLKPFCGSAAY